MMTDINVEYASADKRFPVFESRVKGKKLSVICDVNTEKYADAVIKNLQGNAAEVRKICFYIDELVPDESVYGRTIKESVGSDYILAVGSGSLNDTAKYAARENGIVSGVYATAASMDGYASGGAPMMENGFKVTENCAPPLDVLIDTDVVCAAPRILTASGFGDIAGKYTCLADWRLSNAINGESIDISAYSLMEKALSDCMNVYDGLTRYEDDAVKKLMNALITAGKAMAICGNSRPASGSEHHFSHFLEMDFVRRKEKVPLHGLKVAVGTLISLEMYDFLAKEKIDCPNAEKVYAIAASLPKADDVKSKLVGMGCPVRFSSLGVRRETMEDMLYNARKVRERYTVLTLYARLGITDRIKDLIMEKYY